MDEIPPGGKCTLCGKYVAIPFKCKRCGNIYCIDHYLPENHNCSELIDKEKVEERRRWIKNIIHQSPDSISTTEIDRPSFFEKHDEMVEKIIEAHSFNLLRLFGIVLIFIGGCLVIGNIRGWFPTFPFAGFITMIIGWLLLRA